jgi:hypothetical protein
MTAKVVDTGDMKLRKKGLLYSREPWYNGRETKANTSKV